MNLIEAIKSGKPFRRKYDADCSGGGWHTIRNRRITFNYPPPPDDDDFLWHTLYEDKGRDHEWRHDDLISDDWEIQEPTVTITRAQFWEAVDVVFTVGHAKMISFEGRNLASELAKKLGL